MKNKKPIAVETLTLAEICDMFRKSLEIAYPKSRGAIRKELKHLRRMGRKNHKWVKTYEEYIGAKISFYLIKVPQYTVPTEKIGMIHRTKKGLILVTLSSADGAVSYEDFDGKWDRQIIIYTAHFCERYAERILKIKKPTFQMGCEGIMFGEMLGAIRVMETMDDGIEKIEIQFQEGQAYGYRDNKNDITYLKTIYSDDMLKRDRLDFKMEWEQTLTELFDRFRLK